MGDTVLFERYRLIAPAGSGGSAQVWRALDTETGDEVALKRLHPIVFADASGRQRLEREFRALRGLDAPHVVQVRDLHVTDDEAALILDYVDGKSVAERLAAGPAFTTDETLGIVDDVAEALAAAHAAGIVHRDVTPGNILLDPNDGARLTDFGIALGGADATAVTATGQLMGTLRYLAPEQLRGEAATPSSDLHALAAVAYEMLAGRPVYPASTPVGLAEAHAVGPEPLDGLPPSVDAAVRRGLAADPAARPADVRSFAAELRGALQGAQTMPIDVVPSAAASAPALGPMWARGDAAAEASAAEPSAAGPSVTPAPASAAPATAPGPLWRPEPRPPSPSAPGPGAVAEQPRRRPVAAPMLAILALALAGIALAAFGPTPAGPAAPAAATDAVATPVVTPTPTEPPAAGNDEAAPGKGDDEDKGKGNGNGKGKGNGNGNDDDD